MTEIAESAESVAVVMRLSAGSSLCTYSCMAITNTWSKCKEKCRIIVYEIINVCQKDANFRLLKIYCVCNRCIETIFHVRAISLVATECRDSFPVNTEALLTTFILLSDWIWILTQWKTWRKTCSCLKFPHENHCGVWEIRYECKTLAYTC